MRFLFFSISIFISILLSQGLNTNINYYDRLEYEIQAISSDQISNELFVWPLTSNVNTSHYNFFSDKYDNFSLEPIAAIRYSSTGFEMNTNIPYPILWVSPGLQMNINKILIPSLNPIWLNGWFKFSKHSAYGLEQDLYMGTNSWSNNAIPISEFNPDVSYGYYKEVKFPEGNGIDFDESTGAFSLLSNYFDITFGKLRTSLGPSFYSNVSISNTMPAFNQLRIHYNYENKIYFTFIAGDLFSGIQDSSATYYENSDYSSRLPILPRRLYNHRLDINLLSNFRIGFYEQIIASSNGSSLSYLNPFSLYWSEQHQSGDFDNLQMGFDFDYILGKNRLYGSILIDEWAPYDTFNSDSHNWFATQIGISRLYTVNMGYKNISGKKWKKYLKALLKFEYSSAEPQVYVHKFDINNAEHHNYPVGLWSGGDSIDRRLNLTIFTNGLSFDGKNESNHNPIIFDIGWHNTRIGEAVYDEEVSLLSTNSIKVRDVLFFQIKKDVINLKKNDTNIDMLFKVSYYDTENLYLDDNFFDITTSLIYNIRN